MRLIVIFCMVLLFSAAVSHAIEKAERISDREIIESLAELKAGQKAIEERFEAVDKRFDDMNNSINRRFDDLNSSVNNRFNDVMSLLQILTGAMLIVGGGILGWLIVIWRKNEMSRFFQNSFLSFPQRF